MNGRDSSPGMNDKLDLILNEVRSSAIDRRKQDDRLDNLSKNLTIISAEMAAHYADDKAQWAALRRLQDVYDAEATSRMRALQAKVDAEETQAKARLEAKVEEPVKDAKETRSQLKRSVVALGIGAPIVILISLLTAGFMHWFGWK